MKYQFNACRSLGHAWDQIPAHRRPPWGKLLVFRCTRCFTVREDIVDSNFNLSSRRYTHPDGYKSDKRPRREWMRDFIRSNKAAS